MSIILKQGAITVNQPDGSVSSLDVIVDQSREQAIADIEAKKDEVLASIPDDYSQLSESIVEIQKSDGTKLSLVSETVGAYINDNGAIRTGQGSQFVVKKYKVKSGTIRLHGYNVRLNASLPMVCFRDASDRVETAVLVKSGNNIANDYDETCTVIADGFIYIAIVTTFGELVPYYDIADNSYADIKIKEQIAIVKSDTEISVSEMVDNSFADIVVKSPNLFDKSKTVNGYINTTNGGISSGDGTWRTSDFIEVNEVEKYYSATGGTIGFYGERKNFLGYTNTTLIEPINGTLYIRKSMKVASVDACQIVKGTSAPQIYYPFGYIGLADNVSKKDVSGKILQTFGDSMVGMGQWQEPCVYRLGFGGYINSGHSGYKMSDTGDPASTPIDTVVQTSISADADIVTIWGGTNDFYGNAIIGNPSDESHSTFYGALNAVTKHICESHPHKKIIFITPLRRTDDLSERFQKNDDGEYINNHGKTLEEYVNAMIDVCRRNSIRCLDFYHDGGINKWNAPELLSDGIHPTQLYFGVLGNRIADEVLRLL